MRRCSPRANTRQPQVETRDAPRPAKACAMYLCGPRSMTARTLRQCAALIVFRLPLPASLPMSRPDNAGRPVYVAQLHRRDDKSTAKPPNGRPISEITEGDIGGITPHGRRCVSCPRTIESGGRRSTSQMVPMIVAR